MTEPPPTIRFAKPEDAPLVFAFIQGIAEYEKLSHELEATEDDIRRALSGDSPRVEVLLADWAGEPAAFALFFHNFSSFVGRRGLYLEDLYVKPEYRGRGLGRRLLLELVRLARERGCGRMEWIALDWNRPAIDFYEQLGARPMNEWVLFRLSAENINRLGSPGGSANQVQTNS
jgi:GNAT superfamily N-acetyltransferase